MTKVCVNMVPKNLTKELNVNWKKICSDVMKRLTEEQDLVEIVITLMKYRFSGNTRKQS